MMVVRLLTDRQRASRVSLAGVSVPLPSSTDLTSVKGSHAPPTDSVGHYGNLNLLENVRVVTPEECGAPTFTNMTVSFTATSHLS